MGIQRLLCAIVCSLVLAACTAWQQGLTPGVIGASPSPDPLEALHIVGTAGHPAGHLIVRDARPDTKCPRGLAIGHAVTGMRLIVGAPLVSHC
jgi:hypothetical protein